VGRTDHANEEDDNDNDDYVAPSGLASRRRLHQSYQITQQNDVERMGGNQDAFITVSSETILTLPNFRSPMHV
jgi:nuclear receptor interaction protein